MEKCFKLHKKYPNYCYIFCKDKKKEKKEEMKPEAKQKS